MHTRIKVNMDRAIYPHPLHMESRHRVWWSGKDRTESNRGLLRDTISASSGKNNAFISFLLSLSSVYVKIQCLKPWSMSSSKIIRKNVVPTWQEWQFVRITKTTRRILCRKKSVLILTGNMHVKASCGETECFSMSKQPATYKLSPCFTVLYF